MSVAAITDLVRIENSAAVRLAGAPDWESLLACACDGSALIRSENGLVCSHCKHIYRVDKQIPLLFVPNEPGDMAGDVTEIVKVFYEETPFPNYDNLESRESLAQKVKRGLFARLLDKQIPRGAAVLEAGCGTGQLTNFLGMTWGRTVIGADFCLNSLRLAATFRDRFSIRNAHFLQMNLFRPPFRDEAFDVVICNGALHHAADPVAEFRSLVRKLKPGGYVIVGFYNRIGRLLTDWRRAMIRLFNRMTTLDFRLRGQNLNKGEWQVWFRDQYKHPHESKHSYGEVLGWFDAVGIDFISSIPRIDDAVVTEEYNLFAPQPRGNAFDRTWMQLEMLFEGGCDGGLFMIGRKRSS